MLPILILYFIFPTFPGQFNSYGEECNADSLFGRNCNTFDEVQAIVPVVGSYGCQCEFRTTYTECIADFVGGKCYEFCKNTLICSIIKMETGTDCYCRCMNCLIQ
jgi:hypothetical protein